MTGRRAFVALLGLAGSVGLGGCDPAFLGRFGSSFRDQLASSPDGRTCADGSNFAALVTDCPFGGVCFTSACQAHDACYFNCEASRAQCDRQFRSDMFDICDEQFGLQDEGRRECLYFANLYWAVVDAQGAEYYHCDFIPTEPRPGACCRPGPPLVCEDVPNSTSCGLQSVFIGDLTCKDVAETIGACPTPPNDACLGREAACGDSAPDATLGRCASDSPDGSPSIDRVCSVSSQDCAFGDACLPHDGEAFRCFVNGDTRLATTDGPDPGEACGFGDANRLQADVWYEYSAPCTGTMTIQMCNGTFYDAVLSVYGGDSGGSCSCPADGTAPLTCNDDGCGSIGGPSIATLAVTEGECYVIRVGGWSSDAAETGAARGVSRLDIGVLCDP